MNLAMACTILFSQIIFNTEGIPVLKEIAGSMKNIEILFPHYGHLVFWDVLSTESVAFPYSSHPFILYTFYASMELDLTNERMIRAFEKRPNRFSIIRKPQMMIITSGKLFSWFLPISIVRVNIIIVLHPSKLDLKTFEIQSTFEMQPLYLIFLRKNQNLWNPYLINPGQWIYHDVFNGFEIIKTDWRPELCNFESQFIPCINAVKDAFEKFLKKEQEKLFITENCPRPKIAHRNRFYKGDYLSRILLRQDFQRPTSDHFADKITFLLFSPEFQYWSSVWLWTSCNASETTELKYFLYQPMYREEKEYNEFVWSHETLKFMSSTQKYNFLTCSSIGKTVHLTMFLDYFDKNVWIGLLLCALLLAIVIHKFFKASCCKNVFISFLPIFLWALVERICPIG